MPSLLAHLCRSPANTHGCIGRNLCLLLVLLLHVLVCEESEGATDQDDGVQADAHVGLLGAAGAGLRAGGLLGFGGRVVGLVEVCVLVGGDIVGWCALLWDMCSSGVRGDWSCTCAKGGRNTYTAHKVADKQALEDLAGLVAVADVFEGLGGVLAADVEEDFLTTGVLVYEAWRG